MRDLVLGLLDCAVGMLLFIPLFGQREGDVIRQVSLLSLTEGQLLIKVAYFYRPVLIDGVLEASYPSSTTMLVMCIMPTAMMQFHRLIQSNKIRKSINTLCGIFTVFMVVGRILSGVHWLTDIFGGILLSVALIMLYHSINQFIESKCM